LQPVLHFVGFSDSGKTTLLEGLVRLLTEKGYRVAAIKHSGQSVSMDREGTDTWRVSRAGAEITMLSSPGRLSVTRNISEVNVEDLVSLYAPDVSIVLVEGMKGGDHPKIEVFREGVSKNLLCRGKVNDQNLIAVASDVSLDLDVPVFALDDIERVCEFIEDRFLAVSSKSF